MKSIFSEFFTSRFALLKWFASFYCFMIWSCLLRLKINRLIFLFVLYLWLICGETLVSFEIRIFLNFGNRFELLAYLPIFLFPSLFMMIFGFLRSNKTATAFLSNFINLHRPITTAWIIIAVHFFTRTGRYVAWRSSESSNIFWNSGLAWGSTSATQCPADTHSRMYRVEFGTVAYRSG